MRDWSNYLKQAADNLERLTKESPSVWEVLENSKSDEIIDGLNFIYRNADDPDSIRNEANHLIKILKERG